MAARGVGPLCRVYVHLQQFGTAFWKEFHGVGHGGHQYTLAHVKGGNSAERFDSGDAVNAKVEHKGVEV